MNIVRFEINKEINIVANIELLVAADIAATIANVIKANVIKANVIKANVIEANVIEAIATHRRN